MGEATRSSRHTELYLGPIDSVRVSVEAAPLVTVISLVVDAMGGPRQGVRQGWSRVIQRSLPGTAAQAVSPMVGRSIVLLPDCITPVGPGGGSLADQLDRIAMTTPEVLAADLAELFPDGLPLQWQAALRQPRRWLSHYVTVLSAVWQAYSPFWRQSASLRSHETERVGAAVVSGSLDILLTGINPRARFGADTLYLPDRAPYRSALDGRRVVLVPLLSGSSATVFNLDEAELVWLGYPLPGLDCVGWESAPITDALTALLGPTRASILRLLRRPTTMGALAADLSTGSSSATYHCTQLTAAGLVERRRSGREVQIHRTPRGDALVDLMS